MKNFAILFCTALIFASFSACKKPIVVKAVKATQTTVESTVTTLSSGTVQAEQMAVLGFGSPGRVKAIRVHEGDQVQAGAIIAELDNRDLQMVAEDANEEMGRMRKLQKEGLTSKASLDSARKAYEIARANLDRSVIAAPFDGLVTQIGLQVGDQVAVGGAKPQVRIVDLKPRIVKGDVDEVDLGKMKVGLEARVRVPASRTAPYKATVSRVVPFVDTTKEQDRSSEITLQLEQTDVPIPVGASAEIEIVIAQKANVLSIPTRAILGSGERYVYRVIDGKAKKTVVTLGLSNYERGEVLSGLKEGEVVALPSEDALIADGSRLNTDVVTWPLSN